MLDNTIEDVQLSASSCTLGHPPAMARQYRAGWCADTTDVNPYLQVINIYILYSSLKFIFSKISVFNLKGQFRRLI